MPEDGTFRTETCGDITCDISKEQLVHLLLGRLRKDALRRLTYIQNDVCWLQLARGVSSHLSDLWTVF